MTNINAVKRRVVLSGSAGTGPYAFTFEILDDDDIEVYKDTTLLTKTTDYSVTINANGTGSVTLVVAATSSNTITIIGARDIERTTDFVTAGDLKASSLNEQLDALTIFDQQIDEKVDRSLKGNFSDPTNLDYTIPTVDDRKGKYLQFNSTTGAPEAGPDSADVTTLASVASDIATLADIEDGTDATDAIQTVAGISSNVTTVAGISSNVTTVAGISSDVTAVAGDATDIGTVAGLATEIGRLGTADAVADMAILGTADVVSDLNTLATSAIVTDLDALADLATEIDALGDITSNITTVSGISSNVTTVAGISANVTSVAGVSSDVTTVAGQISPTNNIATVASDSSDIGTVAGISSDVSTVAGISANTTTVAGISANVTTVAGISSDVTTVAGDSSDIATVAGISSDVSTVATNDSNVTSVAGIASNITTVAGISSDVTAVSGISSDVSALASALEKTYTVTVTNPGGGNVFVLDGSNNPSITLFRGNTYIFDQSDSTNSGHPIAFRTTADASYTTGVTTTGTPGSAGAKTTIVVASDAPSSLKYYCTAHGNSMGNSITITDSNISLVATNIANVNTVGGDIANVNTVAGANANITTVASNITGVNSFAERYRISASDPTTSLDEGDLVYNSTANQLKYYDGSAWQGIAPGISSVSADSAPSLGGNLDVNGNSIVSASNGDIAITPNGTGSVVIDGLSHPQTDGSAGQFLKTDGSGQLSFATVASDLVDDTSPQLGGNLDTNGNAILFGSSKWSIELDTGDNDLLFKYNGTTVFKLASNGAVTSANDVTAFGSP